MNLQAWLRKNKCTIRMLSKYCDVSIEHVSRILASKKRCGPKLAERIEKFTDGEVTALEAQNQNSDGLCEHLYRRASIERFVKEIVNNDTSYVAKLLKREVNVDDASFNFRLRSNKNSIALDSEEHPEEFETLVHELNEFVTDGAGKAIYHCAHESKRFIDRREVFFKSLLRVYLETVVNIIGSMDTSKRLAMSHEFSQSLVKTILFRLNRKPMNSI